MIAVIDYGVGNIGSIMNMFKRAGATDVVFTNEKSVIEKASHILLPGVGHFDHGMKLLRNSPCFPALEEQVLHKETPTLGICLGAQMLTRGSQEGSEAGLGWIPAETLKFQPEEFDTPLPVPHMGWSTVKYAEHPLFANMQGDPRFYFVHSFYMRSDQPEYALCSAYYGKTFEAGIQKGNIMGVQFHPEKSHRYGMQLLRNFVAL